MGGLGSAGVTLVYSGEKNFPFKAVAVTDFFSVMKCKCER